jgi:hypothetical protein
MHTTRFRRNRPKDFWVGELSEETAQQIKNPKVRERRERPRDPERLNGARFHGKKLPTSGIHGHCSRPSFHARRLGVNTPGQVRRYPCGKPVQVLCGQPLHWYPKLRIPVRCQERLAKPIPFGDNRKSQNWARWSVRIKSASAMKCQTPLASPTLTYT